MDEGVRRTQEELNKGVQLAASRLKRSTDESGLVNETLCEVTRELECESCSQFIDWCKTFTRNYMNFLEMI